MENAFVVKCLAVTIHQRELWATEKQKGHTFSEQIQVRLQFYLGQYSNTEPTSDTCSDAALSTEMWAKWALKHLGVMG